MIVAIRVGGSVETVYVCGIPRRTPSVDSLPRTVNTNMRL